VQLKHYGVQCRERIALSEDVVLIPYSELLSSETSEWILNKHESANDARLLYGFTIPPRAVCSIGQAPSSPFSLRFLLISKRLLLLPGLTTSIRGSFTSARGFHAQNKDFFRDALVVRQSRSASISRSALSSTMPSLWRSIPPKETVLATRNFERVTDCVCELTVRQAC
jgi:hypothetical protein